MVRLSMEMPGTSPAARRMSRAHGGGHGVDAKARSCHLFLQRGRDRLVIGKRQNRSPTIWPVSWPLPAMSSTSPRLQFSDAARIAWARSPISAAPGAAARMAARMAAGFSLRGLSSVTMTLSAFSAAMPPISGRLPVAVAAGAEHHDQLAGGIGPQRVERLRQRVGLVRIVDEDRRAILPTSSSRPLAPQVSSAAKTPPVTPVAMASPAATARSRSESADQRQLDRIVRPSGRARSACAKPSIAVLRARYRSPSTPTVRNFRPRLRGASTTCRIAIVGIDHRGAPGAISSSNSRSFAAR